MVFNATFDNMSAISWVVAGCIKSHNKYSFTVLMKMEEIFHKHTIHLHTSTNKQLLNFFKLFFG
jgi:flavoprotein